jgi:hypothetical protein
VTRSGASSAPDVAKDIGLEPGMFNKGAVRCESDLDAPISWCLSGKVSIYTHIRRLNVLEFNDMVF